MTGKVKCTCGWSWNKSDSSKKDMYICHECGRDNSNNMKNGGWLDNYNDSETSAPEGFEGDGYSNVGRDYSPAWGGSFQMGGNVYPVNYVPQAQSGTKKKPIHIKKDDVIGMDRYKKYQDSLRLYNNNLKDISKYNNTLRYANIDIDKKLPDALKYGRRNIPAKKTIKKHYTGKVDAIYDKIYKEDPNDKMRTVEHTDYRDAKGDQIYGIDPISADEVINIFGKHNVVGTDRTFSLPWEEDIIKRDIAFRFKKPEQEIIIDSSVPPNDEIIDAPIKRSKIKGIQNTLQPIGIQNAGLNIETELPQIRQHVVQPKYYDVEDYTQGSTNYNGTQSNYRTDDLSTLSEQTPNNTRKIVPHYQMGGNIPGAVGFTYARTQGSAPSNGKYAKKTKASAQDGEKLDVYDNPLLARRVDNNNIDRSYYDPRFNTMNIGTDYNTWKDEGTGEQLTGEDLKYHQDKLLAHENYHALQHLEGRDNYDIAHDTKNRQWAEMQKRPEMMSTDSVWNNFYNRSALENRQDYTDKINDIPEARLINQNLLFDKVLDRERYSNPANLEGEAKFYEDTGVGFKNGGKMQYYQNGLDWKPKSISRDGSVIKDDMGYWNPDNWGSPVEIGSTDITMEGVYEPLLGVSDTGDTKLMKPGKNYKFKGKKVTEFPMAQTGKKVSGGLGVEDWWNNREEIQSTYKMANEVDPFMKNWMNNPITQKRLNDQIGYLMDDNKKPINVINENLNTLPVYDQKKMRGKKTSDFISNYKLQNDLGSEYPDSQFETYFNNLREEPYVAGSYVPNIHSMSVTDINDKGTLAHEMTHGSGIQDEMEHYMEYNYNQKPDPNYPEGSYKKNDYDYLKKDGMYPRIMDIRRELNLKPGQKVDKRIFNGNNIKTDSAIQDLREMYDDAEIIKILNTIADNSYIQKLSTAKNGLRQEQKGLQNIDNLTNFTNYNKPQPGGWLNKYN